MKLSRPVKLLLLVLTLCQPLYTAGFMAMMIANGMPKTEAGFHTLLMIHMAAIVVTMLLLVFYFVHLFRTNSVASDKRALWGITLFCGAPIAMPIYFFSHVWPEPKPA